MSIAESLSCALHRSKLEEAEQAVRASCRRRAMLRALLGWAQRADWRRFQDAITRLAAESLRAARLRRALAAWQDVAAASQVADTTQTSNCFACAR